MSKTAKLGSAVVAVAGFLAGVAAVAELTLQARGPTVARIRPFTLLVEAAASRGAVSASPRDNGECDGQR